MRTYTVMVIDDNHINQKLACDLLTTEGFTVIRATNAEEAMDALASSQPDLILMDIELPGMDGLTLTRQLKSDPVLRSIPVVAMTAFAMKGDDQKAYDAGCDGYITKPIDSRQFPRQVERYIQGR